MDSSDRCGPRRRGVAEGARQADCPLGYAPIPDKRARKERADCFDQIGAKVKELSHRREDAERISRESAAVVEQLEYLRGIGANLDELGALLLCAGLAVCNVFRRSLGLRLRLGLLRLLCLLRCLSFTALRSRFQSVGICRSARRVS